MRPEIVAGVLLAMWATGNSAEVVRLEAIENEEEDSPTSEECALAQELGDDFTTEKLELSVKKEIEELEKKARGWE